MNLADFMEILAIQVKESLKAYKECNPYDIHIIRQTHREAMSARKYKKLS